MLGFFFLKNFSETNFSKENANAKLAKKFLRFELSQLIFPNFIILGIRDLRLKIQSGCFRIKKKKIEEERYSEE